MMVSIEELFSRLRHEVPTDARSATVSCGRCGRTSAVRVQDGMSYVAFSCVHCGAQTFGKVPG